MKNRNVSENIEEFIGVAIITGIIISTISNNFGFNTSMQAVLFIVLCFIYYSLPQTNRDGFAKWLGIKSDTSKIEQIVFKYLKIMIIILFIILAILTLIFLL
jgi:hypothetical protein